MRKRLTRIRDGGILDDVRSLPLIIYRSGKMAEPTVNLRDNKRSRTVAASVSLLALCAAGGLVFGFIAKVQDAADRAH